MAVYIAADLASGFKGARSPTHYTFFLVLPFLRRLFPTSFANTISSFREMPNDESINIGQLSDWKVFVQPTSVHHKERKFAERGTRLVTFSLRENFGLTPHKATLGQRFFVKNVMVQI